MSDQPDDGVVFIEHSGLAFAFLGVQIVGAVRAAGRDLYGGAEYMALISQPSVWRTARTVDAAKSLLRRDVRDWYDSLHTPLELGQGQRLAGQVRVG